jgi:hypothetical protein
MESGFASRLLDPAGIWPWAEHNEGLLSVVALVAALGIAIYEIRQSIRRDVRAMVEYIDWVLDCANRSIELTDDAIRHIDTNGREGDGVTVAVWQMLNGNALRTLEEIQPLRPAHPKLTHHVNRLVRAMAREVQSTPHAKYNRDTLEHVRELVAVERDHIAALRPTTVGERLQRSLSRAGLLLLRRRLGHAAN